MPPKTVPKSDRKRHKITDLQRAALRQRYATQKEAGAAVDHKSLARWFQNTYQFPIDVGVSRPDASKSRISKWPLLEEALFAWQ